MTELPFPHYLSTAMERLAKGAFLTASSGKRTNTMTISWGSLGIMWRKPVCTVMVRPSRYTYGILDEAREFTLSIPLDDTLAEALALCGSKSGRDMNKFAAAQLSVTSGRVVNAPIIAGPCLYLECRVLYRQDMEPGALPQQDETLFYAAGDHHTFFTAEIVAAYRQE